MEEENDWKVSNQNKKNGKKRFLRQLIVFLIAIIVIGIVILVALFVYKNKSGKVVENSTISENKSTPTNTVEEVVQKVSLDEKVYSIEDKDFYFEDEEEDEENGIKLYEYDNTNSNYAEIYYNLMSYTTDPSYSYIIEAKNEEGKSLLLNERENSISEREMIGGITSYIKIDKENLGSKIYITVKEMYEHSAKSRTIERQATTTIDLSKDLEEQKKVDFTSSTAAYELEDIKFETYKDEKIDKNTYMAYSSNCKGTSYSIGVSAQYGNRIVSEEHIEFYAINNINNLSLNEAFDTEIKILENIGDYGLLDKYKIYVSNGSGEITNEFEITFEEMKELLEGKEVNINGKRISAQDISNDEDNIKLGESSNVTIANGIKAIKYNYKNETDRTKYMFILNGYIYYINVPNAPRYETNVNLFLNSLTQK